MTENSRPKRLAVTGCESASVEQQNAVPAWKELGLAEVRNLDPILLDEP